MTPFPYTILTPHSVLTASLLAVVQPDSKSSQRRIAEDLMRFSTLLPRSTRDIHRDCQELLSLLQSGKLSRALVLQTNQSRDLSHLLASLREGVPLKEALRGETHIFRNQPRPGAGHMLVGAKPFKPATIDWKSHGVSPPPSSLQTATHRWGYYFRWIPLTQLQAQARSTEEKDAAEFLECTLSEYQGLASGVLLQNNLSDFPSDLLEKILGKFSRRQAPLMRELLVQAIFEQRGWVYERPKEFSFHTSWPLYVQCLLRHLLTRSLLTEKGKQRIIEDKPLLHITADHHLLEKPEDEILLARRKRLPVWLHQLAFLSSSTTFMPSFDEMTQEITRRVLSDYHWKLPRPEEPRIRRLQGIAQYWLAHTGYGAFTENTETLLPAEEIMAFIMTQPPHLLDRQIEDFEPGLMKLFGNFYSTREKQKLLINPSRL